MSAFLIEVVINWENVVEHLGKFGKVVRDCHRKYLGLGRDIRTLRLPSTCSVQMSLGIRRSLEVWELCSDKNGLKTSFSLKGIFFSSLEDSKNVLNFDQITYPLCSALLR